MLYPQQIGPTNWQNIFFLNYANFLIKQVRIRIRPDPEGQETISVADPEPS
jgi:hypothetical protein